MSKRRLVEPSIAKGFTLLVLGAAFLSTVPVLSKHLLSGLPSRQFTGLWMAASTFWASLWLFRRGFRRPWRLFVDNIGPLFLAGFLATGWVYFYFRGLELIDPAVTTYIMNARVLWGVGIGVLFLGERYVPGQWIGMTFVLMGVLLIFTGVYQGDEFLGILFVTLSSLFFVLTNTLVKHTTPKAGVALMLFVRFFFPALILLPASFSAGPFLGGVARTDLLLILGGALTGPFLSFLLVYSSLKYLALGLHSVVQSISIVFTTLLSFAVFGTMPPVTKLLGGALVVCGIILAGVLSPKRPAPDAVSPRT